MYANINLISRLGYSSVPYCRGSNCTFWGKKPSTSFNYYKSDLKTPPPPPLKEIFPLVHFIRRNCLGFRR